MLTYCRYFKNPLQQYMGALCTIDKFYLQCPHINLLDCTCGQPGYNHINNDLKHSETTDALARYDNL